MPIPKIFCAGGGRFGCCGSGALSGEPQNMQTRGYMYLALGVKCLFNVFRFTCTSPYVHTVVLSLLSGPVPPHKYLYCCSTRQPFVNPGVNSIGTQPFDTHGELLEESAADTVDHLLLAGSYDRPEIAPQIDVILCTKLSDPDRHSSVLCMWL